MLKRKIEVCLISETKISKLFPNQPFKVNGYKMIGRDRDSFGGGLIFCINEQIPVKGLSSESIPRDIELILLHFTVKNSKWFCIGL